jgi:hypothetical protein
LEYDFEANDKLRIERIKLVEGIGDGSVELSSELLSPSGEDAFTIIKGITCNSNNLILSANLPNDGYILFGYSFSATVIIESYSRLKVKPATLLLLSPTPSFYYPSWSLPLIRMPPVNRKISIHDIA